VKNKLFLLWGASAGIFNTDLHDSRQTKLHRSANEKYITSPVETAKARIKYGWMPSIDSRFSYLRKNVNNWIITSIKAKRTVITEQRKMIYHGVARDRLVFNASYGNSQTDQCMLLTTNFQTIK
jgi:hypothetical protein